MSQETQVALAGLTQSVAAFPAYPYARLLTSATVQGLTKTKMRMYLGSVTGIFAAGSNAGNLDSADWSNGFPIPSGVVLYFVWDLALPGYSASIVWERRT